jgi:hypothetical protein
MRRTQGAESHKSKTTALHYSRIEDAELESVALSPNKQNNGDYGYGKSVHDRLEYFDGSYSPCDTMAGNRHMPRPQNGKSFAPLPALIYPQSRYLVPKIENDLPMKDLSIR